MDDLLGGRSSLLNFKFRGRFTKFRAVHRPGRTTDLRDAVFERLQAHGFSPMACKAA